MGRHGPSGDDRRDALRVSVTFLWIIVDSMIGLASACLLIGIVVAGVMMLADRAYLSLFDQWLVAVILYMVCSVAKLVRRPARDMSMVVVVMPAASVEEEAVGAGSPWSRRPLPLAACDRPRLTLIAPGR